MHCCNACPGNFGKTGIGTTYNMGLPFSTLTSSAIFPRESYLYPSQKLVPPMFEQTFKNVDDILHKDAGCGSELDYVEQTSWILFLKYLYPSEELHLDVLCFMS
ncbi:hypothetical protein SAMN03080617_03867 [Algoriphagus alkaliphilus]|uniref:Uncharacterized protein n=2 Tax=Algoriphagus alkaliphilus TaxID=279824 RepID=A0A1G5ZH48_9BACT|nr:hypothetical protein SAMN03080617_03867 [Algoriphagus alkaliphilus]